VVRFTLRSDDDLEEYDCAYVYLDAQGNRVFQYDDAPHHSELPTHPHHWHKGRRPARSPDRAFPLDMPAVSFVTVLNKVIRESIMHPKGSGE
jgi:hypothetical protein